MDTYGTVSRIRDYLNTASPVTNVELAQGAAIAVMSSFAAGRYRIQPRGHHSQVVAQSVLLVGQMGSGKGQVMESVEQLFQAVGDASYCSNYASLKGLWQRAEQDRGLLLLLTNQDHKQLADRGATSPLALMLDAQASARGQAPITVLAETRPETIRHSVDREMDGSLLYGEMLIVPAPREYRVRQSEPVSAPPAELLDELRALSALRERRDTIMVQMDPFAALIYRKTWEYSLFDVPVDEPDAVAMLAHRVLNVAALFAIGVDHQKPVITLPLFADALKLAIDGREIGRLGFKGIHELSELAQLAGATLNTLS